MICCDGVKCPILWFHADCVGLSEETMPAASCGSTMNVTIRYWYL